MAVSGEGIIHLGRTEVGGSLTVDSTKLRLLRPHVICSVTICITAAASRRNCQTFSVFVS